MTTLTPWVGGLVAALLGASSLRAQGEAPTTPSEPGFLSGEGRTYFGISYHQENIDSYHVGSDRTSLPGDLRRETWTVWMDHGITDRLELTADLSYADNSADSALGVDDESGIQDLSAGIRWETFAGVAGPGTWSLILAPSVKIPVGGYESETVSALGDGQVDLRARVQLQYSFDAGPFVVIESGYDFRLERTHDDIPFSLTVGTVLFDRLVVAPYYLQVESTGGDELSTTAPGGPGGPGGGTTVSFDEVEEDYQAIGIGAFFELTEDFGLTADVWTNVGGRNTPDGNGFAVGFVWGFGGDW